jgi:hypothetical protein
MLACTRQSSVLSSLESTVETTATCQTHAKLLQSPERMRAGESHKPNNSAHTAEESKNQNRGHGYYFFDASARRTFHSHPI